MLTMRPLRDRGRTLAAGLLASLLGTLLLLGTLEVHGGAEAHSALERPTIVFTGARHATRPAHLETSGVRELPRCAWCVLHLQGLGDALPVPARLAGLAAARSAPAHRAAPTASASRQRPVSRGPPLV
jgi:hypothetical protein